MSGTRLGRPLAITPGVPDERVKALRAAFDATMKDAEFRAEAEKLNFEVDPVRGEELQKVVAEVMATPKGVAERAKDLLE
jgi:tripartite-type tricarboxylate transporter receptor subunit TctC